MLYKSVYKCRLCSKVYEDGTATGNREIVDRGMMLMVLGIPNKEPMFPNLLTVHRCDELNTGVADFQGFKGTED